MDSTRHDELVALVREWLEAHRGQDLSVATRTGETVVPVASGPFLGLEEHPVSKGVFRALFTDAHRVSLNPDEIKYVSFGFELEGVESGADRLVLDKGGQLIEIGIFHPDNEPRAEDVTWWDDQPVATGPAEVPAEVAPVPLAPQPSTYPAPQPPAAPVPVAPQPPTYAAPAPPAYPAPSSSPVMQSSAMPATELRVRAPLYSNSMGSGFFGIVTVRIEQGWMSVTGMRSRERSLMLVFAAFFLVLGVVGIVPGLIIAINAVSDSDMGAAFCFMGVGLLMGLIGLALHFVGRSRAMRADTATLQFRLADARGRRIVRYDDNIGCLLMLLLTPIIGLIVMLAMGRRLLRLNIPDDRGMRQPYQSLVLKTLSSADGALLGQALRG
ncbi:MAG TPA: hypothetical protein VLQ52_05285 [Coriobacteriia bacterium]|nr:hypothetical protein [Coriobacteriia bacterium]